MKLHEHARRDKIALPPPTCKMQQRKVGQAPTGLKTVFSVCGRVMGNGKRENACGFIRIQFTWTDCIRRIHTVGFRVSARFRLDAFLPRTNLHRDIYSYPVLSTELNKQIQTNGITRLQGTNAYVLILISRLNENGHGKPRVKIEAQVKIRSLNQLFNYNKKKRIRLLL